jgi:hypothetical protein
VIENSATRVSWYLPVVPLMCLNIVKRPVSALVGPRRLASVR